MADGGDGRPKQARAIETRRRLLQGTVDALVELGYAGASTTVICERASVSQGALYKHFPTKASLIAAAIEYLFARLIEDYLRRFQRMTDEDRLGGALRLLWETFTSEPLQAAFEVYLAARTDSALRETMQPVLAQHRSNLRATAKKLFPEVAARNRDFDLVINGLMATMQGGALMMTALPPDDAAKDELAFIEQVVRREFERLEFSE